MSSCPCISTQVAVYKHSEHTARESLQMSDIIGILTIILNHSLYSIGVQKFFLRFCECNKQLLNWSRTQCSTDRDLLVFLRTLNVPPMTFEASTEGPACGYVDHKSRRRILSSIGKVGGASRFSYPALTVTCHGGGHGSTTSEYALDRQWVVERSDVVCNGTHILVSGIYTEDWKLCLEIVSCDCRKIIFNFVYQCGASARLCSASVCPRTKTDFFTYLASRGQAENSLKIDVFHVLSPENGPAVQRVNTIQVCGFPGNSPHPMLSSIKGYPVLQADSNTIVHIIVMRVLCKDGCDIITYVLHIPGTPDNAVIDISKDRKSIVYESLDADVYPIVDQNSGQMTFLGPAGYWTGSKSQMHEYALQPGDWRLRHHRISFHDGVLFMPGQISGVLSASTDVLMFGLYGTMYTKPTQAHITEA